MDRQQFISQFDPMLSKYLRERVDESKLHSTDGILQGALERVYEIFSPSGKRVRPYSLYLMYVSAGGNEDIMMACVASELQHAFALVHDDIIDKGDIRHGVKTIQEYVSEQLRARGFSGDLTHQADSHAMLVGDLVLLWSCEAINLVQRPNKDRIMSLFLEMARKSTTGELLDISIQAREEVADAELNRRDMLKTSADTFINPMLIGAALADKENRYGEFCKKFGILMGEVFQIQDDILDILGEEGTPEYSDIKERQHTFLTQYVLSSGSQSEKKTLHQFFSRERTDDSVEHDVLQILSKDKVIDFAKQESRVRLNSAKEELTKVHFAEKHEKLWLEIVSFFEDRFD